VSLLKRLLGQSTVPRAEAPKPSVYPVVASAPSVPKPSTDQVVSNALPVDPSSLFTLPANALLGIVGESYYSDAIKTLSRTGVRSPNALTVSSEVAEDVAKREPDRELLWFEAQLLPMPDNSYDSNAVAVVSAQGQVGYLPRASAAEYVRVFDWLTKLGYSGAICPAFVDADKGCVVVALSWASVCEPKVNAERRKRAWGAWQAGDDLEVTAVQLGFDSLSKLLAAARKHAKECGLEMPPTASELKRRGV